MTKNHCFLLSFLSRDIEMQMKLNKERGESMSSLRACLTKDAVSVVCKKFDGKDYWQVKQS